MSTPAPRFDYVLVYSKTGPMVYLGHLDLMRFWERILRQCDMPLRYSEGFQKTMKIDTLQPVPLGVPALHEYLVFSLVTTINTASVLATLNSKMVPGLSLKKLVALRVNSKWFHHHKSAIQYELTTAQPLDWMTVLKAEPDVLQSHQIQPDKISFRLRNTMDKQINIRQFVTRWPEITYKEFKRIKLWYTI